MRQGVVLSPLLFAILLIQLLKGLKHLMLAAILIAFAAVFFFTPMSIATCSYNLWITGTITYL